MMVECGIALTLLYFALDWSWWQVVLAGIGGFLLLGFRTVRFLYCVAISVFWASLAWDLGDAWWMGALFFILSLVFHWPIMKLP